MSDGETDELWPACVAVGPLATLARRFWTPARNFRVATVLDLPAQMRRALSDLIEMHAVESPLPPVIARRVDAAIVRLHEEYLQIKGPLR